MDGFGVDAPFFFVVVVVGFAVNDEDVVRFAEVFVFFRRFAEDADFLASAAVVQGDEDHRVAVFFADHAARFYHHAGEDDFDAVAAPPRPLPVFHVFL